MKHRARKRFGQNFLKDSLVLHRIVDVLQARPDDLLIEIGPGRGALTRLLVETGAELLLVELDRDLVEWLGRQLPSWIAQLNTGHRRPIELHNIDALKCDYGQLSGERPFRLVGNLPYNISTPLIFHLLETTDLVEDMHFMLQAEVVDRMAARPGGKTWGKLSVMCQYHCSVTPMFRVPPTAFSPQPRVESSFVRLVPHLKPPVQVGSLDALNRVVTQAFSQRRKTLRNSLKGCLDTGQIESVGLDPSVRPEMVGLEAFGALAQLMP